MGEDARFVGRLSLSCRSETKFMNDFKEAVDTLHTHDIHAVCDTETLSGDAS